MTIPWLACRRFGLGLVTAAILAPLWAGAAEVQPPPPAFVPVGDRTATELSAGVNADWAATLEFERTDTAQATKVQARVLQFRAADGRVAEVGFADPKTPGRLQSFLDVSLGPRERVLAIPLTARGLAEGVTYEGRLAILPESGPQLAWKVKLAETKLGYLVLDVNEFRGQGTLRWCSPWCSSENARFTVRLRDRDGLTALTGLRVRAEGAATSPAGTLDLGQHLSFILHGGAASGLWRGGAAEGISTASSGRELTVPRDRQAELTIVVNGLGAGEHQFALRVDAANSRSGPEQKIAVTLKQRHSAVWALGVMLLGAVLSWFTAKGIANWRAALQLEQQLARLRPDWLRELPPVAPVMWLRATRNLSRALIKGRWRILVPAPEAITARLDRATWLLDILGEHRRLIRDLAPLELPYMTHFRARQKLASVAFDVEPERLDAAEVQRKRDALATTNDDLRKAREGTGQRERAWRLHATVCADQFDILSPGEQSKIERLLSELHRIGSPPAPAVDSTKAAATVVAEATDRNVADAAAFERIRAVFEILVDRRADHLAHPKDVGKKELENLVAILPADGSALNDTSLMDLFRELDKQNWARLKTVALAIRPADSSPHGGRTKPIEPVEAYSLISFRVEAPDNPDLNREFLLSSLVECTWHFVLTPAPSRLMRNPLRWRKGPVIRTGKKARSWSAQSLGNHIVQYAPYAGTLDISVAISFDGALRGDPVKETLTVEKAREFARIRSFQASEVIATAATFGIAIVTGMSAQYLASDVFGSVKDYVALFLWAAALDTGKNMVQALGATAASSPAGGSRTPPAASAASPPAAKP